MTGAFHHFQLTDGITTDKKAEQAFEPLPAGSLRLADLGYFSLDTFEELTQTGVFWISRLKVDCKLFDAQRNAFVYTITLNQQTLILYRPQMFCRASKRLPARFIALRCSKQEANKRRRQVKSDAKRKGGTPSKKKLQLAEWHTFITNVDITQLTPEQVITVYPVPMMRMIYDILTIGSMRYVVEMV